MAESAQGEILGQFYIKSMQTKEILFDDKKKEINKKT